MLKALADFYYRITLGHPFVVGLALAVLLGLALYGAQNFKLDASSDSLLLQDDEELRYYREVLDEFGSSDFLIVTFSPKSGDLFAEDNLSQLKNLREDLTGLPRVTQVLSMLDVPLLNSPGTSIQQLQKGPRTLLDEDTDKALARKEFKNSPLYSNMLMNQAATVTALLVTQESNEQANKLLERRSMLRMKREESGLSEQEQTELQQVSQAYDQAKAELQAENQDSIAAIRAVLDKYRDRATIHLGGLPMIAADMVDFVRDDLRTFGVGVGLFIIVLLAVSFGRPRWVVVPGVICALVCAYMLGFLGYMDWRVTIVSSNFVSLLLIITLSLIVHLIVRHRELHNLGEGESQDRLLRGTINSKFAPTVYTVATTVVSFASLTVADVQPVIDFGWMMVVGVLFAFAVTMVAFPAMLAPLAPGKVPGSGGLDLTAWVNRGFANTVERRSAIIWAVLALVLVAGGLGISRLSVENRFIDYFDESTQIYQGMRLIDQELGGTTPLDVIVDAPASFTEGDRDLALESKDVSPTAGYWFNEFQIDQIHAMHDYLDSLDGTGKVLSLSTMLRLARQVNDGKPLGTFTMAIMYRLMPADLKAQLIDPYMSQDGNTLRFAVRVIDSAPGLERDKLIKQVRTQMIERFDLEPEQVRVTGLLVLYNNVLQSLFDSLLSSMVVVLAAIALMFLLLFRSLKMALIGPLPTVIAVVAVLGLMGWLAIPLDIMTITIAAITIGIGVHDTIHYSHRFQTEVVDGDGYDGAVARSHGSVGRAMFYTTVIITLGFSILMLSNFKPTIYFGLFTGAGMVFALISNLALLPLLLTKLKPFGRSD